VVNTPASPVRRSRHESLGLTAAPRRLGRAIGVAVVCVVAGLLSKASARAEGDAVPDLTLTRALAQIAGVVAKVVKAQGGKEIVVNPISDKGDLTHTAGTGVTDRLLELLRRGGIEPVLKGDFIFEGEFKLGEATDNAGQRQGFAVASIAFVVKRRNGKELYNSERELELEQRPRVTDTKDVAGLSGATVSVPPKAPAAEKNQAVLDSLDNKPGLFELNGTKIKPKGSPYALEMLVAPKPEGDQAPPRAAFQPRAVIDRAGFPFLKVQPGEVIALRIFNDTDHEAAAAVTIDGLSLFAFRDDKADKSEHLVIDPHQSGEALGWYRNDQKSSVFLVADLPNDHPKTGLLKNPARIGSITVTFAAAWEKDNQKPADEPVTNQATEIIPGAPIDVPFQTVPRKIGVFRAAVTVRYDKS
jgi:hypothetical protein